MIERSHADSEACLHNAIKQWSLPASVTPSCTTAAPWVPLRHHRCRRQLFSSRDACCSSRHIIRPRPHVQPRHGSVMRAVLPAQQPPVNGGFGATHVGVRPTPGGVFSGNMNSAPMGGSSSSTPCTFPYGGGDFNRLAASELAKTKKLNGTNFHAWKCRIILALTLERLICVINNLFLTLRDKPIVEEMRADEAFETDYLMAKTIMLVFMEDDLIKVFEDCSTAKEMFDTISSKYNTITMMHVQLLLEQYNSYKMKELDRVVDHVNKMLVMVKDLAVVGNVISDNMIYTIMNSLPPS
ncbi:hypothetical protein EJ110_NYTH31501 [Nymphaea thermarum]|nr:hypothetical protein EJ110_NYTH31501 [Nymphaea thermarum]